MRVFFAFIAGLILVCSAVSAQCLPGPAGSPPSLPPAFAATVESGGIRVAAPDGKAWCEIWPAKSLPAAPRTEGEAISLPQIPHGALLGVLRFPAQGADRRGNPVQAGAYAMRYSVYPADGNHMGAAPQRDFVILIPVEKDKAPETRLDYKALMELVKETTGAPHPAVLSVAPSEEKQFPTLKKEGERDWVLHVKIGGTPIAIIVVGRSEG